MSMRDELIARGAGVPAAALETQGQVQLALIGLHPEVKDFGWTDARTEELRRAHVIVSSKAAAQLEAQDAAKRTTLAEGAAVTKAKTLVRQVRNVLRPALRAARDAGVAAEAERFASGRLERSTPKLQAYLDQIAPELERLNAYFAPYFPGHLTAAQRAKALSQELSATDTTQRVAIAGLPVETAELYAAKGRLLELIEELNGIAKNAFDGQAVVAAQFNKDLLLRARRKPAEAKEPK